MTHIITSACAEHEEQAARDTTTPAGRPPATSSPTPSPACSRPRSPRPTSALTDHQPPHSTWPTPAETSSAGV
ncbi:hypothetical protein ACFQVA_05105 [Actinomadura keratinilytica]